MVITVPKTVMKPEKLEFFRHMLNQKINELLEEAGKTVSEMTNSVKENYPDPNDRASLESDRNFELRIRDRERKLILKMQEAIKRIDDGVFGICDVCGGHDLRKKADGEARDYLLYRLQDEAGKDGKAERGITSPSSLLLRTATLPPSDPPSIPRALEERRGIFLGPCRMFVRVAVRDPLRSDLHLRRSGNVCPRCRRRETGSWSPSGNVG